MLVLLALHGRNGCIQLLLLVSLLLLLLLHLLQQGHILPLQRSDPGLKP